MRTRTPLLPVLAAAALLTAGCGAEHAGSGSPGSGSPGSGSPGSGSPGAGVRSGALPGASDPAAGPGTDGVRIVEVTTPTAPTAPTTSTASPDPGRAAAVTAPVSAVYEITNDGTEALTYTVLFTFTSDTGEAMANVRRTEPGVGPGRTVRRSLELSPAEPGARRATGVRVTRVTAVPAAEAPADAGECPSDGVRISADEGDAAMGLRVVGLWLENCGTAAYHVDGYPEVTPLGDARTPVDGVEVLSGAAGITSSLGPHDGPPRPVTLEPGERARAVLVWRNTTEAGLDAVSAPYARIRAKPGADPVVITPHLDLGTTGRLGVTAWRATDDAPVPPAGQLPGR
jgi:hypothetical protein